MCVYCVVQSSKALSSWYSTSNDLKGSLRRAEEDAMTMLFFLMSEWEREEKQERQRMCLRSGGPNLPPSGTRSRHEGLFLSSSERGRRTLAKLRDNWVWGLRERARSHDGIFVASRKHFKDSAVLFLGSLSHRTLESNLNMHEYFFLTWVVDTWVSAPPTSATPRRSRSWGRGRSGGKEGRTWSRKN